MKKIQLLCLFLFCTVIVFAQQKITGRITDAKTEEPLAGVTVLVKGTAIGEISQNDGSYSINVPAGKDTLVFSFVGYELVEMPVIGRPIINVGMSVSLSELSEVVVIGYGTQKKVSITNAVSNITSTDLATRISTNATQALQGKLPGLVVIDYGGAPGVENLTLRIRGITSLNNNNPLVLIDGIEGSISQINPADIESVSILKDAAATAIYGSRAAAGVILVTTKGPEKGSLSVSYNGTFGFARSNNKPVHMEAVDYLDLQNAAYLNSYGYQFYTDEYIQNWPSNHASDPEQYPLPNTWFQTKELLRNAPQHSHTLVLSGGSDAVNTRVSIRRQDELGIFPNYGFKINEIRANTNYRVNQKLLFKSNINLRNTIRTNPVSSPMYRMSQNSQWGVPLYADGSYGLTVDSYSPLIQAKESGIATVNSLELIAILRAEYEVIKGLKLNGQYSKTYSPGYSSSFTNRYSFTDKLWPSRVARVTMNSMTDARSLGEQDQLDLQIYYENKFGGNTVSGIAGYSWTHYSGSNVSGYRQNFYNNDLQTLSLGASDATRNATGGNSEWALLSYFSRINYDYNNKYLLELNARYDGSSRFADGRRFGFFPSFSLGWRISNEDFWSSLKNTVNELKLRGSWGQVGSQQVGLYTYLPTYNQSNYIFGTTEALATGYRQTDLTSTNLSWETTSQVNVGLDASMFEGMLTFSGDYYKKTTRDILLVVPIPTIIGLNATNQNAGIVENEGVEFLLGLRKSIGEFDLNLSFNANYNENTVVDLAGAGPFISAYGNSDWRTITTEGQPYNSLYGFKTDGYFQTQEEVNGYAKWDGSVGPGDVKYVDINNDGLLTPDDFVILGDEMPDWTFSSNMSVARKGLKLELFWQGVAGSQKAMTGAILEMGIWGGFCHEIYKDYWTPENTDARFPRPTKYTMKNVQMSDRIMLDGSYLRLKNIRLSYDLPQKICDRMKIGGINVFVSATNLLTFAEMNQFNIDPEMIQRGQEGTYPQTSVSTIGLNINF